MAQGRHLRHVVPNSRFSTAHLSEVENQQDNSSASNTTAGVRIFGGSEAPENSRPYLAAIYREGGGGFMCGGSLIAPEWILTAAHCADDAFTVYMGLQNRDTDPNFEKFGIVRKIKHPYNNPDTLDYDFALLNIDGSSAYSPVHLNSDPNMPTENQWLSAVGWGLTESNETSIVPLEANEQDLSNDACNTLGELILPVTDSMMCAWASGITECHGDSGGPLVDQGQDLSPDEHIQYGVVSWGVDPCAVSTPVSKIVCFGYAPLRSLQPMSTSILLISNMPHVLVHIVF
ncbi:MAG: S1 family serine peptidase [Gaiellaceae bacterium]